MIAVLLQTPTSAQVLYGSLTGNVSDPNNASVAGAKVEARNVNTGTVQEATTDSNGIYRFVTVLPGTYTITITAAGFAKQENQNILVIVNTVRRLDVALTIGRVSESVTVTTEAPLLQTDKADVHTDLTARQIDSLPDAGSQGRNFQSLLRLIPGTGLTAETNSLAGNPQRAINTNVNGQSNQTNNTRIDGAQDAYVWLPANVAYVPPADAIETVNVVTNAFDAEQGMAGGAAVNVQIKSGTNQFHGSGHWFHTDQNFATQNYFQTALPKLNRNNQNQFGGTIGGPIVKNKLFFFGDYERTTQRGLAGPQTRTLPTANMVSGDFRGLVDAKNNPVIIYDPATGNNTGGSKQQISCNGVLNVICPDRFDPAAVAMINLLQPALGQVFDTGNNMNNFTGSGTAKFDRDTVDVKINYIPSQKSMVFGRYSFSKSNVFDPPLLGDAGGDATAGGQLGNAPGLIQSVGLGATYTFSPNLLLDWNFGYTRQRLGAQFDLGSPKGEDLLGIQGTNGAGAPGGDAGLYNGLPAFTFPLVTAGAQTGANLGNPNTGNPFLFRDNQWVSGANLSWIHGRHQFRGGMEWNHGQINHFQPQGGTFQTPRGSFQFNGTVTGSPQGVTPGWFNAWADFLLGLPSQTGKAIQLFNPIALRWNQWAWYARDQWQVTPKLTLNLGLRWEFYPFGYSDNGKGLRYFDINTGNVLLGGYGSTPIDNDVDVGHGRFLPRVGAAYRLTSSTVIRAGYGQSADPNNWRYFRNAYPSVLLIGNAGVTGNSKDFVPAASLTGQNGTGLGGGSYNVPTGLQLVPLPDLSTGSIPLPQNIGTTTIRHHFDRGYINSFNFTVQQEVRGFVLETGYVGARGIRPLVNMNANASLPGTGSPGGLISVDLTNKGVCESLPTGPKCNYTQPLNALTPFKNNYYDSLQTRVTRRFKQGSTAGFVWTWSKATDYQGNEELAALKFPHPDFWWKDRAVADFDRTHNIRIYGIFQMPFGKGQPWLQTGVANHILGGWQVSPVISYLTGLPFTVTGSGSALNANGSQQTADLVGKFHLHQGKPKRNGQTCTPGDPSCSYFDPTAFAQPFICPDTDPTKCPVQAPAHYGTSGRNQFRGPGYFAMDLSLARNFKLNERFTFQFRADAFGLTNTPHFANPNAGCNSSAAVLDPNTGSGQLCNSTANFGVITNTLQPGGFFGPDPGTRSIWLAAKLLF